MKHSAAMADTENLRWQAVLERDARSDGKFVFGVLSTGVYCRPSCPARRPLRRNVRFFDSPALAEQAGLRTCLRCKPRDGSATKSRLVERLCRYIETNTDKKITLENLSELAGISRFHLQRVFTAELGISPAKYLRASRFAQFKSALRKGPVTAAWAEAGYSSPSRVYETARARLGMAPSRYGSGASQEQLRFTVFNTSLGKMLLVANQAAVCSVQFLKNAGDDPGKLLRAEYSNAQLSRDDKGLAAWTEQVRALVAGEKPEHGIPLDIRGTAFQQKVWQELQKIPAGQTRTYSEVAQAIGQRAAVRAVATACGSNSLAVVVPCHRVVHKDGSASGYRWGTERKQKLLKSEKKLRAARH